MKPKGDLINACVLGTLLAASLTQVGCAAYQTYKTEPVLDREVDIPFASVIDRVEQGVSTCWNRHGKFFGDTNVIRKYWVGENVSLNISPEAPDIPYQSAYLTVAVFPVSGSRTRIKLSEATTVYSDRYRGFAPTVEHWIEGDPTCGARVPGH